MKAKPPASATTQAVADAAVFLVRPGELVRLDDALAGFLAARRRDHAGLGMALLLWRQR